MNAYGPGFAKAYDARWSTFAAGIAPLIHTYYETACLDGKKSLLDVCCGTGQLSTFFLEKGYRVAGIDASEHMLSHAREHAAQYVSAGKAQFIRADASDFKIQDSFGLTFSVCISRQPEIWPRRFGIPSRWEEHSSLRSHPDPCMQVTGTLRVQ
jgi:ubiquinone/menaquinone biosynthesis C-methylase UbiE